MPRCPKCNHELNEYEVNRLWCTNCNANFESVSELIEMSEAEKAEMLQKQSERVSSVSGSTDDELSSRIEGSGRGVRTIFRVFGVITIICAGIALITSLEAKYGGGVMFLLGLEMIGVSLVLFAIGNLIYCRTLGLARSIQQQNEIIKLLREK